MAGKTYQGIRSAGQDGYLRVYIHGEEGEVWDLDPRFDLANHSPTGFECGYRGSGPAQLALAMLADLCGEPRRTITGGRRGLGAGIGCGTALRYYQSIKDLVVLHLPKDKNWEVAADDLAADLRLLIKVQLWERVDWSGWCQHYGARTWGGKDCGPLHPEAGSFGADCALLRVIGEDYPEGDEPPGPEVAFAVCYLATWLTLERSAAWTDPLEALGALSRWNDADDQQVPKVMQALQSCAMAAKGKFAPAPPALVGQ